MRRPGRPWFALALLLLLAAGAGGEEQRHRIVVFYPDNDGDRYPSLDNLIGGATEVDRTYVMARPMSMAADQAQLDALLERLRAEGVILLGHRGLDMYRRLDWRLPVMVAAAILQPGEAPGVSLASDPEQFFALFGDYTPAVRRAFVMYDPAFSGWFMDRARRAARKRDIELLEFPVTDVREAVAQMPKLLAATREGDALWLPLDPVVQERALVPTIMEEAWRKRLVVVANTPALAEAGAIIALFPDYTRTGRWLVRLLRDHLDGKAPLEGVLPLDTNRLAVNRATAELLGVTYDAPHVRTFSLIYPRY